MRLLFPCGADEAAVNVPDGAAVWRQGYPEPESTASELVRRALAEPIGASPLREALKRRRSGPVAVVVSDVTRPIPYAGFLGAVLDEVQAAGVSSGDVVIIVATGMHRPSTPAERVSILGGQIAPRFRVVDHRAEDDSTIEEIPGKSRAGARVRLCREFVRAGFRIVTGLVEPHFMAGFSGGRKAVCPGLSSLETVRRFHGAEFLANPLAANGRLDGNPLHEEALSVARMAGVDFSLNVVLDSARRVVRAFAGELETAHEAACRFVRKSACPRVERPADVVVTSCGGSPLDATFYQCVKGLVSCLPAVRPGGTIIAVAGCAEGVGSPEYSGLMRRYSGAWRRFLDDIRRPGFFVKDQWQFQMHCRALEKVGQENVVFITPGLGPEELRTLSVSGVHAPGGASAVARAVEEAVDSARRAGAMSFAAIPDGPYCAPMEAEGVEKPSTDGDNPGRGRTLA